MLRIIACDLRMRKKKHTLFSRTVQIACVKTHAILRTGPMRFYAGVIFDAIIRNEKTQRILSESTLIEHNCYNVEILLLCCLNFVPQSVQTITVSIDPSKASDNPYPKMFTVQLVGVSGASEYV